MEEAAASPQVLHTTQPPFSASTVRLCSLFFLGVCGDPFICGHAVFFLWVTLILPQFPTIYGVNSLKFPTIYEFSKIPFLFSCLPFPFSLPFSSSFYATPNSQNASINSYCFSYHLYEDASQIYIHSISRCLLGISIWKSFLHSKLTCPKLNSLIPH